VPLGTLTDSRMWQRKMVVQFLSITSRTLLFASRICYILNDTMGHRLRASLNRYDMLNDNTALCDQATERSSQLGISLRSEYRRVKLRNPGFLVYSCMFICGSRFGSRLSTYQYSYVSSHRPYPRRRSRNIFHGLPHLRKFFQ
jgi:hypothetical protein